MSAFSFLGTCPFRVCTLLVRSGCVARSSLNGYGRDLVAVRRYVVRVCGAYRRIKRLAMCSHRRGVLGNVFSALGVSGIANVGNVYTAHASVLGLHSAVCDVAQCVPGAADRSHIYLVIWISGDFFGS